MCRSRTPIDWTPCKVSTLLICAVIGMTGTIIMAITADTVTRSLQNPTPTMIKTNATVTAINLEHKGYVQGSGYCTVATATLTFNYPTTSPNNITTWKQSDCYSDAQACGYYDHYDDDRDAQAYKNINTTCPLNTQITLYYANLYPNKCSFDGKILNAWLSNSSSKGYFVGSIFICIIVGAISGALLCVIVPVCFLTCQSKYKFACCDKQPKPQHELTSVVVQKHHIPTTQTQV